MDVCYNCEVALHSAVRCDECKNSVCTKTACLSVLARHNCYRELCSQCITKVCMCCALKKDNFSQCSKCEYRTCYKCLNNSICKVCTDE